MVHICSIFGTSAHYILFSTTLPLKLPCGIEKKTACKINTNVNNAGFLL